MAERRSERRARKGAPDWAEPLGLRQPLSQRAGDGLRDGDDAVSRVLEAALRHRERVERATHGFHTYPAGLHPDAAAALLGLAPGPVLDPFCGGGTVIVEALLASREALGTDVSPVATLVARARTALTTEAERTALRSAARKAADVARTEGLAAERAYATGSLRRPELPEVLFDWYEPHVLVEMHSLRREIKNDPLLKAIFSSIVVKTSLRESDTSNRRSEEKRPAGTAATLFHKRAREFARQLEALAAAVPAGLGARVHRQDAREQREKDHFGLALSSPPYPGVYDYVPLQQLRTAWLGLDQGDAPREEIGSRRSFRADRAEAVARWRADTAKWVRVTARALVPGGRLVVVTGDGNVGGKAIDSLAPLTDAAVAAGMRRVARATVERWDEGLDRVRPEHAVCFERGRP
ncbi:MAG: hypothetical protein FJ090_17425 [Deltaproteobacteria bacterium]|nr:hypothetical protein [Deltaproteobacteria bacterium]